MVKVPGVPRTALVERDGQQHAFFVIDNQLEERVLALGAGSGGLVGVHEGAKIGEKIVIRDVSKLSNGQHVR
jgi:hypothetical protein